jgi:tetratricopeptide (TPR) repeat protein
VTTECRCAGKLGKICPGFLRRVVRFIDCTLPGIGLSCCPAFLVTACSWLIPIAAGSAAEIGDAEKLFKAGRYSECAKLAAREIENESWDEDWPYLKVSAELAEGKYAQALETIEQALQQYDSSVRMRLLAREVFLFNGDEARAGSVLQELDRFVMADPSRYDARNDRVAVGRFLLQRGADPRQVLELVYDPLRKEAPGFADVYFATAELALEKYDFALAADTLRTAPRNAASDPQYHYLLARAYESDDPQRMDAALTAALAINPRHSDSLLLRVDRLIDAEQYTQAENHLKQVLSVNSNHPLAWAYKAVLAHLESDAAAEQEARDQALARWKTNPEVDHLIGRKLSQKYRFAEGAAYQRRALAFDAEYRPAKLQLSQDLLRLGEEDEGWRLAKEVAEHDGYDVLAFNLVTLEEQLAKFRTIGGDGLLVRMDAREADLYGERILELLRKARTTLGEKYKVPLDEPIVIEIFPQQKDFAVRTFGMPGIAGFLGVCFGRVITANSPASQGENPANWEAVLWHEFCHVVTLHKTRNKMPRWLSEGISVYEERQADATWGQSMTPQNREIIASGKMTPVSRLSSAFLSPPSPLHLQFAYYESSLVVEYLIEEFGMDALQNILDDLGEGSDINEALIRHTVPLGRLDADFEKFARERAEALAPGGTWEKPQLPPGANSQTLAKWLEEHPKSIPGLVRWARQLLVERKFKDVIAAAQRLKDVYPNGTDAESGYAIMAAAHRGLGHVAEERAALEEVAARDSDAVSAYLRLMEIGEGQGDWESVARSARRMLAVNPLVAAPHRYLAQAAEKLGRRDEAIGAYKALLFFDTTDSAETHFRLAQLLGDAGNRAAAKRHVLQALEEAPRFLAAHRLLLELADAEVAAAAEPSSPEASSQ